MQSITQIIVYVLSSNIPLVDLFFLNLKYRLKFEQFFFLVVVLLDKFEQRDEFDSENKLKREPKGSLLSVCILINIFVISLVYSSLSCSSSFDIKQTKLYLLVIFNDLYNLFRVHPLLFFSWFLLRSKIVFLILMSSHQKGLVLRVNTTLFVSGLCFYNLIAFCFVLFTKFFYFYVRQNPDTESQLQGLFNSNTKVKQFLLQMHLFFPHFFTPKGGT